MVWDDHDMHDDWNISERWVREMRREEWWHRRVEGGIISYWIYQHLGNLTPAELRANDLFERVRGAGDAGPLLREFARHAEHEVEGRAGAIAATGEGCGWSWSTPAPGACWATRATPVTSTSGR
jgi:hypothetical protein